MYEKIAQALTSFLTIFTSSTSGFWGWVLKLFTKKVSKKIIEAGEKLDNKVEAKRESEQELEKYEEAISKPDITKEERLKADRDLIGG